MVPSSGSLAISKAAEPNALPPFEIARVLVRLDHVVNANHGIM